MANVVRLGPEYMPQSSIGRPIANADIYVGLPDTDPEIVGNQKTLSVLQEDGTIVAVAQPISTGAGGVPMYGGDPVTLLVDGNYSLKVLSSLGAQIYYVPSIPMTDSSIKGADIASASPLVIGTDGNYFDVTGVTGFAAMTVAADKQFTLQFDGILTMTHHATNLDLPGEANITTAAGDVATFQSTGANTVQCISYTRANGTAVAGFASSAEIITGTEVAKVIAPDQLRASEATAAEIITGTAVKLITVDQLAASYKSVPVGAVFIWATGTVPAGYLECDGSSLDRTTYANLFAVLGVIYGNADGTHFNLPDYRGRFLRGWAHGQTTDPDKATRTDRGDTQGGDYVGTKQADELKSHLHNVVSGPSAGGTTRNTAGANDAGTDKNTALTGGNETRPININVMFIIKY